MTGNWCVDIQDSATYVEQVTVQGKNPNNFQIVIGALSGSNTPVVNPPASSAAAFQILNTSVTVSAVTIQPTNSIPYGVQASSAYVTISSVSVMDPMGKIAIAGISISSQSAVSYSSITVQNALGLRVAGITNTVSNSSISSTGNIGIYLTGASSNLLTRVFVSLGGVEFDNNSTLNTISLSTAIINSSTMAAIYDKSGTSNTVMQSYFQNMIGNAIVLGDFYNTVQLSTAVGGGNFLEVVQLNGKDTITQSYVESRSNNAVSLLIVGDHNIISSSTVKNFQANTNALTFNGASSNTVTYDFIQSGTGGAVLFYLPGGNDYNTISFSTITSSSNGIEIFTSGSFNVLTNNYISGGNGANGVRFDAGDFNTVANSYVQGSPAVFVQTNHDTVSSNVLAVNSAADHALELTGGVSGLTASANIITGGSQAAGIFIDVNNSGTINLSSNTMLAGAQYGVYVATQASGAQVWITSNTVIPTVTSARNSYGIYLNGLATGATIQNNSIVYRTSNSMGSNKAYGFYAQSSKGLNIDHNRISNPGMLIGGSLVASYFLNTRNTQLKFNDFYSASTVANPLVQSYLLQLQANSTSVSVRDNIFFASMTVNGVGASSATVNVDLGSETGFVSDYNDWFSANGMNTGILNGAANTLLAGWQGASGQDANSISSDPLWNNPGAGVEDFHPQSQTGRFDPVSQGFTQDCFTSPTIDKADPAEAFNLESSPNGSRANQGSYGNTAQASQTFQIQPPASIGATALIGQITVSWTSPNIPPSCQSYVNHYALSYSSISAGGPFNSLGTVSSNTFAFVHSGLQSNTTYFYDVFTVDVFGSSSTPAQTFAVTPDTTPPAAITNLSAVPGNNVGDAVLNWTFPGDDNGTKALPGGSQYGVQYTTDNVTVVWSTANVQVTISTGNVPIGAAQSATISGLNQSTLYYFRVFTAHPGQIWSQPSNIASSFSKQAGPQAQGVFPPDGSFCISRSTTISFNFSKAVQQGSLANAFSLSLILDNLGNSTSTAVSGTLTGSASSTTFSFAPSSSLIANGTYLISVTTQAMDLTNVPLAQAISAKFTTVMDRTVANVITLTGSGLSVNIPAGAVGADGCLVSSTGSVSSSVASANQKLVGNTSDLSRVPIAGSVVDLKIYDTQGNVQSGSFSSPVTVSIPYPDANGDGIVDGSNPPVRASTLSVWWLDEADAIWVRLPTSSLDAANKRVTALAPHFTTFSLIGQSASDLNSAYAFPVPFRPAQGHTKITFTGLGQNTRVRIFTITGELVAELHSASLGGQVDWNVTNSDGRAVASGVYLYLLDDGPNTAKGKLVIIR